ncbi:MAG: metallophosphoesterase family protein [Thaumarchaeota archaeon]|nr:metallophosphoesterase family protein [Nitrososphaerota archaeon]
MRAYFISDVHGNFEALEAVANKMGESPVYCLGDMVGYGPNPNEILNWIRQRGAICVMGNHEQAVSTGDVSWFNQYAAQAALWTRRVISEENKRFIQGLPQTLTVDLNELKVFLAHGSPTDPLREYVDPSTHMNLFEYYLTRFKVNAIALGHTHIPYVWPTSIGVVFNPGSVGQPRSGDHRACFAEVDSDGKYLRVEHHYVEYDIEKTANKISQAGLPAFLSQRLFKGL